jgi:hypothetical protein
VSASVAASASAADAAPAPTVLASWTDPGAIDALVRDCHVSLDNANDEEPGPLACKLPYAQSCAYDPCWAKEQNCRWSCDKTCATCDGACSKSCDACKKPCVDDACRRDCASRAGACKQECRTSLDRCATGGCAPTGQSCSTKVADQWRAHHCSCKKILEACDSPCIPGSINDPKNEPCFARCRARFPGCDIFYCVGGNEPVSSEPAP